MSDIDPDKLRALQAEWPDARPLLSAEHGRHCVFPLWDLIPPYDSLRTSMAPIDSHRYVCGSKPVEAKPYCARCYQRQKLRVPRPAERAASRLQHALQARASKRRVFT